MALSHLDGPIGLSGRKVCVPPLVALPAGLAARGALPRPSSASAAWGEVFPAIDITRGLDTFHVPVFLALGRYDFLVAPPASWDPIRPHFRNLTVRVFERSGHTPPYEEADLFDAELLSWMKKY